MLLYQIARNLVPAAVGRSFRRTYLSSKHALDSQWGKVAACVPPTESPNYSVLDKKLLSDGKCSAVDLDLFANTVEDAFHLEELSDLLHRFRRCSETVNLMEPTVHSVIRTFVRFNDSKLLLRMLDDRLNYGLFPDSYMFNFLMNHFLASKKYLEAAKTATIMMLQEDFENEISAALAVHSCAMFLNEPDVESWHQEEATTEPEPEMDEDEVKKVRVSYLVIPYDDGHFDLSDPMKLIGKTLLLAGSGIPGQCGLNAEIVGAALLDKPDVLLEKLSSASSSVSSDVLGIISSRAESLPNKDVIHEALKQLKPDDSKFADVTEAHVKATVSRCEANEIVRMESTYAEWEKERLRRFVRQNEGKKILERIAKLKEIKEDLRRREQLLFFYERESELERELRQKIPRHFTPPPAHIRKFIEKSKARVAKKAVDYVPPVV